jgi:cytoskeleton protein RodZ
VAGIGSQLREAREALQLSLLEVEKETRIRRSFLQAMEEDRFADLPGDVYTRGFLRNYALFLNLNPQPLLDEYESMRAEPAFYVPEVIDEPLLPARQSNVGGLIFLTLMVIVVISLLGWFIYNRMVGGADLRDLLRGRGIQTSTSIILAKSATPIDSSEELPTAQMVEPTLVPSITPLPSPTVTPAVTLSPTVVMTKTTEIQVQAAILGDTWVVVSIDGETTFQGTLATGDQLSWVAQNTLNLHIGNAAGISITVNGITVGVLGGPGEVKDVVYTLETLPQPAP